MDNTFTVEYSFIENQTKPFLWDGNTKLKTGEGSVIISGENLEYTEVPHIYSLHRCIENQIKQNTNLKEFSSFITGIKKH